MLYWVKKLLARVGKRSVYPVKVTLTWFGHHLVAVGQTAWDVWDLENVESSGAWLIP